MLQVLLPMHSVNVQWHLAVRQLIGLPCRYAGPIRNQAPKGLAAICKTF